MEDKVKHLEERLGFYYEAINKIDDYFEYRYSHNDLKSIRAFIYSVLDDLTKKIESNAIKGMRSTEHQGKDNMYGGGYKEKKEFRLYWQFKK